MKDFIWIKISLNDYFLLEDEFLQFDCGCAIGYENVIIGSYNAEIARIKKFLKKKSVAFEVLNITGRVTLLESIT